MKTRNMKRKGEECAKLEEVAKVTPIGPPSPMAESASEKQTKNPAQSIQQLYKSESASSNPKGRPKSGRTWKTEQRSRFSAMKKDKVLHTTWKYKMAEKARLKSVKAYENELKEARRLDFEKKKEERLAKKKRQEENTRKSEVVQVIKNTAKIRRMKKKELRKLQKR